MMKLLLLDGWGGCGNDFKVIITSHRTLLHAAAE